MLLDLRLPNWECLVEIGFTFTNCKTFEFIFPLILQAEKTAFDMEVSRFFVNSSSVAALKHQS